jgi:hypothetical protein
MNDILPETKQPDEANKRPAHNYFIFACGVIALLLLGFIGGQSFERARINHSTLWRNNYRANFFNDFGPRNNHGMMGGFAPMPMRSFGLFGTIFSIDNNKISVQGEDGVEQSIQITNNTVIRHNRDSATVNDLKSGQRVAVFGQPNNQGQIAATLIRIFDNDNIPAASASPSALPQQNTN